MIADHHHETLGAAISTDIAERAGVQTITDRDQLPAGLQWAPTPGLLFPWSNTWQYRPDQPPKDDNGRPRKYLFEKGVTPGLNIHPDMADRVTDPRDPLVIVEGTKQHLAAVTAATTTRHAIIGIAGCYGWSHEGAPVPGFDDIPWAGREITVIFDADVATNPNVHEAARRLGAELELKDAATVRYATLPGDGKQGLDDVLAARAHNGQTTPIFEAIVRGAGKLGKPPKPTNPFMGSEGLRAAKTVEELRRRDTYAVDPGGRILVYTNGVYKDGTQHVRAAVAELLGDSYRAVHERSVTEVLAAQLHVAERTITGVTEGPLVNLANGLLNPYTGELLPHSPDHLSVVQLPVEYNPAATCPTFDTWINEVTSGRGDDLLEATATMLDMRGQRQRKAVLAFGPTRSGKSTFIRLIERIAGADNRSAVTLHDLAGNRFAAADLFGAILNTANELSAAHIDDLAIFKSVTGDDPVRAERKYGQPFTFRNRALFVFAGNDIPTVSEVSGAYLARMRPYIFPHSYEGREDPQLEARMMGELPGILNRLVEALNRFEARGHYMDTDESREALDLFARRSDRVRMFLHEATTKQADGFTPRSDLYTAFEQWCAVNRRQPLGRHKFYELISIAGHKVTQKRGIRGFAGLELLAETDWGDDPGEAISLGTKLLHAGFGPPEPAETVGTCREAISPPETASTDGAQNPWSEAPTGAGEAKEAFRTHPRHSVSVRMEGVDIRDRFVAETASTASPPETVDEDGWTIW